MNVRTMLAVAGMIVGIAAILASVGGPAAVASYHHAYEVFKTYGEAEDRAAWLPLTTDGMLIAALVVMYSRRWAQQRIGFIPWLAFGVGFVGTIAANLASADAFGAPTVGEGIGRLAAAVWAPISFAVTLELVAVMLGRVRDYVARTRAALDGSWPVTHFVGIPMHPYSDPAALAAERDEYAAAAVARALAAQPRRTRPEPTPAPSAPASAPVTRTRKPAPSAPAGAPAGAPATNGHASRWTEQDEAYRIELQNEVDTSSALPSVRSVKSRYGMGQQRAEKIVARLVVPSAPEPVR